MADKQNRGSHKTEEMHFLYTQTEILKKKKKKHKTPKYVVFIKIQKNNKKIHFLNVSQKKSPILLKMQYRALNYFFF